MAEEDDFLSRWSRRKRSVAEEEAPPEEPALGEKAEEVSEPETDEEETALLESLGLPKPETLGPGDDFKPFMQAGVPGFLRRRALKALWRSNPVLANVDGLNDYDEDFNSPELTKKILGTGYQIGRGFVKQVIEHLPPKDETPEEVEPVEEPVANQEDTVEVAEVLPEVESVEPDVEPDWKPRRMRFET